MCVCVCAHAQENSKKLKMKFPTKIPNRKSNKCKAANHGPKALANHSSSCSSSSNLNESLDILRLEPLLGDSKTPHHHQRAAAGHLLPHSRACVCFYVFYFLCVVVYGKVAAVPSVSTGGGQPVVIPGWC